MYPQPETEDVRRSQAHLAAIGGVRVTSIPSPYLMPAGLAARMAALAPQSPYFLWPGASTPLGALGHVSAGLELVAAFAMAAGDAEPDDVVVALGSGGSAVRAGRRPGAVEAGERATVVGVRVADRVVTNRLALGPMLAGTQALLTMAGGGLVHPRWRIDGAQFGRGYGHKTRAGDAASPGGGGVGRRPRADLYGQGLRGGARAGGSGSPRGVRADVRRCPRRTGVIAGRRPPCRRPEAAAPSCRRRRSSADRSCGGRARWWSGLVLIAGCGSSTPASSHLRSTSSASTTHDSISPSSDPSTASPATTAPTTASVPPTSTTAPVAARSVPAGAPVVTAQDAVLRPPAHPQALAFQPGSDPCRLLTGTAPAGDCGEVTTDGGRKLVWFVSDHHSPGPTSIAIYGVVGANLVQTLELPSAVRPDEDVAHVEAADLDGLPGQELVVGFRNIGTGGFLQLEVIGAAGTVVASDTVDQGRAIVAAGVIDTWAAQYGPSDPNCCPGTYVEQQIVFDAGSFRLVTGRPRVRAASAPAGQFP